MGGIETNAATLPSEAWLECEKCGELIEGRDGHQVMERLAAHRIDQHSDPYLAGAFISPHHAGT